MVLSPLQTLTWAIITLDLETFPSCLYFSHSPSCAGADPTLSSRAEGSGSEATPSYQEKARGSAWPMVRASRAPLGPSPPLQDQRPP